jgi:hypothetical protein
MACDVTKWGAAVCYALQDSLGGLPLVGDDEEQMQEQDFLHCTDTCLPQQFPKNFPVHFIENNNQPRPALSPTGAMLFFASLRELCFAGQPG